MKRYFGLILLVSVFISGCGDVEWFPDNYGTGTNNGNTTIPTSMTRGAVTVSNVNAVVDPNSAADPKTYNIFADAINTATTDANVTVDVIALDSNGATIATSTAQIIDLVPAGTTQPINLAPVSKDIPLADATRIQSWGIVNLTVQ